MSHMENSEEAHQPHWIGEHRVEWVDAKMDTIHISAKAMDITWGNDKRFWQWIKLPKNESCFEVAAELVQVNWMEVKGSLDLTEFPLSSSTTYEIFYIIKFKVDAMGWESPPVTFELITPDGHSSKKTEILQSYQNKGNGWHNVHGGEFSSNDKNGMVRFGMSEVQTDWWKGGMIFEGIIIRPKLVQL